MAIVYDAKLVQIPTFDAERALEEAVTAMKKTIQKNGMENCEPLVEWLKNYVFKECWQEINKTNA